MRKEIPMNFLDSGTGYALFSYEARKKSYVDKSMLIDAVHRFALESNKFICITRPRRFGKSTAANMVAAFFDASTAEESRKLFEKLEVGSLKEEQEEARHQDDSLIPLCWAEQGKRHVIRINQSLAESEKLLRATLDRDYEEIARLLPDGTHRAIMQALMLAFSLGGR